MRVLLALLVCLLLPGTSFAHGLMLYAYAQGGVVYCEAYGDDERALAGGRIEVRDSHQELLLEGTTGKDGKFSFPIPKIDELGISVQTGDGHRQTFRLLKNEVEDGR
jgi:nickel transport protein